MVDNPPLASYPEADIVTFRFGSRLCENLI